jgi:WD40 repeat protein
MSNIVNPYIAGNPVTSPEMFFGREDIFQFIRQTLTGQHRDNVIVLYGQRRTGKTSVLYQMHTHLDPHYLCIFIDIHGLALEGLGGFLWELANEIVRALRRRYQIELPRPNRPEFMADPRNFFENEFLNQVWSVCGDRHVLLMLDESIRLQEQVLSGRLEHDVFEYMRHLMQHYERLNFLFSLGSGLEEMEKEYAFLFNVGLYKKISFLDRNASNALITQPVKDLYQVEPTAVERIYQITSGHPYYTQLLCHSLFNRWQQQRVSRIEVRHVDKVLDEVVERGLAVLKHVWEESTSGEKAIMVGMASSMREYNSPIETKEIVTAWIDYDVVIPKREISKAIRSLISREVIAGQHKYVFTVDLQRLWLQKYRRLEWVREEILDVAREWSSSATNNRSSQQRRSSRRVVLRGLFGLVVVAGGGVALYMAGRLGLIASPPSATPTSTTLTVQPHPTSTPVPNGPLVIHQGPDKEDTVSWSPDGTKIASAGNGEIIEVWDSGTGNLLFKMYSGSKTVYSVAWSPDGTKIASGQREGVVKIWNTTKRILISNLNRHTQRVNSVAWSSNSKYIVSGSGDKTAMVWDVASEKPDPIYIYHGHSSFINAVAWSHKGSNIVSGGGDKTAKVWEAYSGIPVLTYGRHTDQVLGVAWSPDDSRVASASFDGTVQVWDAINGTLYVTYSGHSGAVLAVAWSPDGNYIASCGVDKSVHIWDATNGTRINRLSGHSEDVEDVSWSRDNQRIASAGDDNTVQVWLAQGP